MSKRWLLAACLAAIGAAAAGEAFFTFRSPLSTHLAVRSAQSAFSQTKLNILLLGYQDDENTTDTIVLAHIDVENRTATLVSIPRDTWVTVPNDGPDKINAAYAYGGATASKRVVSALMGGIRIDATIALQPEGAAQIVDAMGGLNVPVDEAMDYDDNNGDLHIHLHPGEQYLTGSQVLGYLRFRHDASSDFGRMHRQQQVLKLLVANISQPQNWAKLPKLVTIARKDVQTSLTDRQLVALLQIYRNVPAENIRTFTLPSKPGWVGNASVVFVDHRWAALIGSLLFTKDTPPADAVVIANATGNSSFGNMLVGTLRGAGWNVPTFLDERERKGSVVLGAGPAAAVLSATLGIPQRASPSTMLVLGTDLAPSVE